MNMLKYATMHSSGAVENSKPKSSTARKWEGYEARVSESQRSKSSPILPRLQSI